MKRDVERKVRGLRKEMSKREKEKEQLRREKRGEDIK